MKNYRKHVDEFFKEKLGSYKEAPPADVWDDLNSRLDTLTPQTPGTSFRWVRHLAIVSLIVFLGASVVKKMYVNNNTPNIALNETTVANTGNTPVPAAQNNDVAAAKENTANNDPGNKSARTNKVAATGKSQNKATNNKATAARHNTARNKTAGNNQALASANTPAKNEYNATFSKPADRELIFDNSKGGPSANTETPIQPSAKKANTNLPLAKVDAPKAGKPDFARIEAGLKIGYEGGFNDNAAMKLVVAPYIQYNLSARFAIMTQPAVKYATISTKNIGEPQSYYRENSDSSAKEVSTPKIVGGSTEYNTIYTYSQTHDSIVKSYSYRGTYMEFEIPLLLKYKISKKVSVYGGVNVNYSRLTGITENTYTMQGIQKTVVVSATDQATPAAPAPVNTVLTYTVKPYTDYNGTPYIAPQGNLLRVGYMVGFTYEYTQKWLFDALIQQTPAGADVQGGYNINSPLSATYFRLSVGYRFTK